LDIHAHYEELCAVAASGQASESELADLRAHLEGCPSCRALAYDFTEISAQALSALAAKRLKCEIPSGMELRFAARARSEGIEISRKPIARVKTPKSMAVAATTVALAATVLFVFALAFKVHIGQRMRAQLEAHSAKITPPVSPVSSSTGQMNDPELQQKLAAARAELNSMAAVVETERQDVESAKKAKASSDSLLAVSEQQNSALRSEKIGWESRIAQLEDELEKSKSEKNASDVALTLQDNELKELRRKVAQQSDLVARQEDLVARGNDVRDLVVARNLHIIDVHDRDGEGKSQRAFGRIFYTEGKSLIFYAYDLADVKKLDAKVSFYVWGEHLGVEKPVRSLGIFHNDDENDGRWVLTFDDPHVLAQIDSVFVTAETSKKTIKEPGGRKILFAFLGDKPNHP
jgi:hypothetical protein